MKYLILLFLLISSTTFAQSYSEQIAKHREEYKADFLKNENKIIGKHVPLFIYAN